MALTKKKGLGGLRVLTPPIDAGARAAAGGGNGGNGGTPRRTGGSGGGTGVPAATFDDFYAATRAAYTPREVEVDPFDRETAAASVGTWLRPQYDRAITDRQLRTDTAGAELDADALSRNMGTSAYVTDVKGRMEEQEARDVATLEAEYGAEVQKYLTEMEQAYLDRKTDADIFNAGEWNDAMARAYESAMTMYRNYLDAAASGGGGRRKSAASVPGATGGPDVTTLLEGNDWAWERIAEPTKEEIYAYLEYVCTPQERDQIYYGNSPMYATIRAEILKSLGTKGTRQLHWDLPGNETYPIGYHL